VNKIKKYYNYKDKDEAIAILNVKESSHEIDFPLVLKSA
jgi:hypothetical protein